MAKIMKRARAVVKQQTASGIPSTVLRGLLASLGLSVMLTVLLSVFTLLVENSFIDGYLNYIMVAVTILSIFTGSVYAAHRAGSRGLLVGALVGAVYVLISVAIGMEINKETISLLTLANKFIAGVAVGALGGLMGVNL